MATAVIHNSPPPRSRRSSWSWRSHKRRNSESAVPSSDGSATGRTSMSAVDPRAEFLATHFQFKNTGEKTASAVSEGGLRRARRTYISPPPAFFNRGYHQRTTSAAAALERPFFSNDDAVLLRPPATRSRTFTTPVPGAMAIAAGPILATQPWSLQDGIPLGVYPPTEQDFVLRTQRASARMQETTDFRRGPQRPEVNSAPMIQRPAAYADNINNNVTHAAMDRPVMYNTPRRLSNSSTVSTASSSGMSSREVFDSRVRTASMSSSQTSISQTSTSQASTEPHQNGNGGAVPRSSTASYTNWQTQGIQGGQYPWQRPAQIKPQRRKAAQGELFAALPGEVLEMILDELRQLHLKPSSNSCATCWMRDCCSVAVSARKFLKYAREALYTHIHLQGHEGPNMKKRTKSTYGSRLTLLRRTMRSNQQIAVIVRSLKPPALPQGVDVVKYSDLIASVVMAAPNFERLLGFYPTYNHAFQRLYQALSTRPKLKEMNWILEPSPSQQQQRSRPTGPSQHWGPVDLTPQESRMFLDFHINWKQLSSLVIHCHLGATLSPPKLLERTIRSLPGLKTLVLSHIPSTAFNDSSLLSLPALTKLSLTHCTGITTSGLSTMATRPASASLQTLTLIHINLESLPTLARLFSNLTSLQNFNLVQAYAPNMDPNEFFMFFPYLASQTLRKLHWDIPYLPNAVTTADTILARSIEAGGFPALRYLCAPNDPEGIFQRLCSPCERIDQPMDRYRGGQLNNRPGTSGWSGFGGGHTRNSSSYSSSTGRGSFSFMSGRGEGNNSAPASPMFAPSNFNMSLGEMMAMPRDNSNLHQARMAAQQRLETARRVPKYFINVFDEGGNMVDKFGVGAFMGTVESKIKYVLVGDASKGETDEGGGLVTVEDMLRDDGGEALVLGEVKESKEKKKKGKDDDDATKTREGCIGRWNTYSGNVVDKKDKERWWHAERGRWRATVLS
ncbi:hypothetical protein QBC43DRAFT_250065 [Cladorrhinum sp. PSN259]|nr:hypothetical protein QBC43DRAFT_250065 [Cladorrhinum sp. PSN259]